MTDLLSIGASALLANQAGLLSVGQNIANANNEDYSRQEVVFSSLGSQGLGAFSGQGVLAEGTRRLYDGYLVNQLRYSTSQFNKADTLARYSSDLASVVADNATGLSTQIQDLFDAFQAGANNPSSESARSNILFSANSLKNRFSSVHQQMLDQYTDVNSNISTLSDQVNNLTEQLVKINNQLKMIGAKDVLSQPNDILDARDKILLQISNLLEGKVVTEKNGVSYFYLATGEALVSGDKAAKVSLEINDNNIKRPDLVLNNSNQKTVITNKITSGILGGTLLYRDSVLRDFDSDFNQLATNLVSSLNAQHAQGLTLNNEKGGDFFKVSTDGSADLFGVVITNVNDLALAQPFKAQSLDANDSDALLDNRNSLKLASLTDSILSEYNTLVFNINNSAHSAESDKSSADSLLVKAKNDHQSLSGVNLDEEAAQLTKYQQTFNAAAQLISISRTLIDDLLKIF